MPSWWKRKVWRWPNIPQQPFWIVCGRSLPHWNCDSMTNTSSSQTGIGTHPHLHCQSWWNLKEVECLKGNNKHCWYGMPWPIRSKFHISQPCVWELVPYWNIRAVNSVGRFFQANGYWQSHGHQSQKCLQKYKSFYYDANYSWIYCGRHDWLFFNFSNGERTIVFFK